MNESTGDAWFYTREGERSGPVTFADLVEKAREGSLNPRLDMVWSNGMESWKPAGEVDGLFEKRGSMEERESLSAVAEHYAPPMRGELGEKPIMDGWPGARRRSYLIAVLLFPVLWHVLLTMGTPFLTNQLGKEIMGFVAMGAGLVPLVVALYFGMMRLVNVGMSRWWMLGNLIPVLNLWVGYRIFACPGGYVYHKKLDKAGVALAIVYWLLVIVSILAVVAFIALLFGKVGSPELQEKLRELIRQAQLKSAKS